MKISNYYPVLSTADLAATRAFYQRHFGFAVGFDTDWYVHLIHTDHPEVALAIVASEHESIPESGREPTRGLLLNFEVEDVDAEHERLKASGAQIVQALRDEAWGQRHFIVAGPDGVLIDVIRPIPPAAEYADAYLPPVT